MEENNRFRSWWRTPRLTREELNYIKSIESVFKVKNANKQWIPYYMMPHQIDFHKKDVALKGPTARDRVVVKSRNTSFTTSALISNLMAVPYYPSQEIPFVRLNEKRAYDLVDEAKEMIRNMTPVNVDGVAYPFNPKDIDMDSAGKIRFPNKVTFQAYPANAVAAENIRGLRIAGSAGMLDECFTRYTDIYIKKNNKMKRINISRIKPGDEVLSFNEKTKEMEYKPISGVLKKNLKERELVKIGFIKDTHSIECTLDHPFYDVNFNIIQAKSLKVGDNLITNKKTGCNKLSDVQLEVLYGIILGDGYLSNINRLKSSSISVTHGMKQIEYADYVGDLLELKKRKIYKNTRSINGYVFNTPLYYINGRFSSELFELRTKFYKNNKKIITKEILDLLTPISLAFWFMDDGSKSNERYSLHTESFTKEENETICKWFKTKYDITCSVRCYKGYYLVYFDTEGTKKLDSLISEFIHPSMRYKLTKLCKHKDFIKLDNKINNYKVCKITSIKRITKRCRVYNIDVKDNHNFFVGTNQILVHNCNFMQNYNDIYISLRDAAAGYSLEGEKHFQMNIGTTLKGTITPFALWFKKQQEIPDTTVDIYKWEVFDPALFDVNKPPIDQPNLIPIVPWHNIVDLNKKYLEDLKTFLEEYMAMVVDSDTQFYPTVLYDRCEQADLKVIRNPVEVGEYYMGVDVASVLDFFVITVFKAEPQEVEVQKMNSYGEKVVEKEIQNFYKQVYLFYDRGKDLREMENMLKEQLDIWIPLGLKKARIDSQGSGLQLYQNIKKIYHKQSPNLIENIPLGNIKKGNETIKMKEFVHTNQKKLMVYGNVKFIKDETQKMHYSMWDYDFDCDRTKEYGHGDTTIANAYALLPLNFKGKKQYENILMAKEDGEIKDTENMTVREVVDAYNNMGLKDKLKILRKNKGY